MKKLSESLDELAGRMKVLEDSATATFEADRARLEQAPPRDRRRVHDRRRRVRVRGP